MSKMTYAELIQKLYAVNLYNGVKLGLQNMLQLDAYLNHPSSQFESIHVAGTNGKGTVTTHIATALKHAGYRVGHFTSPHISSFRERIRINGEMIPQDSVNSLLSEIFAITEMNSISATFFEITTALAFAYFAQQKVEIAVIETGLGGRLDATNILQPKLSIITSITLEHTEILGNSIDAIAEEKAGIIKSGVPVVVGPRTPHFLLKQYAEKMGSPFIAVNGHFDTFIQENQSISKAALEALNVPKEAISIGLQSAQPCRFEVLHKAQKTIILDVAHNPDGILHLCQAIRKKYPMKSIRVICGFSKTKDISSCLKILAQHASHFHFVESPNGRNVSTDVLRTIAMEIGINQSLVSIEPNISLTVQRALSSCHSEQILVICGSFFIMSEARATLGIEEPRDEIDLNERCTQICHAL